MTIEAKYNVLSIKERSEKRYFWASLVMLAAIVAISMVIPNPSDFQIGVIRLVMALASAAFVAFLPGMLTVQGALPAGSFLNDAKIKASGAFAVFILVYYYAPKIMR